MKITIYELLGMVKDGKAPKKIRYNYTLYEFNDKKGNYYEDENCSINWDYVSLYCLNDEVEILDDEDEEKGLPKKLALINYSEDQATLLIHHKVDEIIDYLEKQRKGDSNE